MDKISRVFAVVWFVLGIGLARMKVRQLERVSKRKAQQAYDISNRT